MDCTCQPFTSTMRIGSSSADMVGHPSRSCSLSETEQCTLFTYYTLRLTVVLVETSPRLEAMSIRWWTLIEAPFFDGWPCYLKLVTWDVLSYRVLGRRWYTAHPQKKCFFIWLWSEQHRKLAKNYLDILRSNVQACGHRKLHRKRDRNTGSLWFLFVFVSPDKVWEWRCGVEWGGCVWEGGFGYIS